MDRSADQPLRIEWLTGVTMIRREQRIEDDAIVFGSVIDDEWHPFCRMVFDGNKTLRSTAISALAEVNSKTIR